MAFPVQHLLSLCAAGEIAKLPSFHDMFIGTIPGSVGETSTIAILIGAVDPDSYGYRKLEDYGYQYLQADLEWDCF